MSRFARYKAALAAVALAVPGAGLAERVAGASLPDGSVRIGENRYRVRKSYEDTLKYFRAVYAPAKFPRKMIVDTAEVKAVHIVNPEARAGQWEGLNVYELKNDTRVYVLVKEK
ncbi:MAG TPA: hypothetical protein VLT61_13755 [Anaeromyxobacteraceae bacterium]|nr:hypothetical protein [Anaeromyxobacteraceae bacterium]